MSSPPDDCRAIPVPLTGWRLSVLRDGKIIQIGLEPKRGDCHHDTFGLSFGRWFGFGATETYYDGPWSWVDAGPVSIFLGGRELPRWLKGRSD